MNDDCSKHLNEGGGALEKGFTCTWRLWLLPIVVTATPPATELAAQRSRKEPEPWGRSAHFLRQEVKEVASLEYHRCSPSSQVQGGTRQLAFCQAMADNTVVPKGAELRLVEWRGSQPIVSRSVSMRQERTSLLTTGRCGLLPMRSPKTRSADAIKIFRPEETAANHSRLERPLRRPIISCAIREHLVCACAI
ncbi:unnamed protein product [Nesidiocoris tenuis]|uniref:Uncharacterized protein n=1 Tax=Nesidiocoris tenuis TaxID=355587 RepID=A0A6H5GNU5_9HEMI|nr:unnamed protein product [Nesidiocoris tenuis]